MIVDDSVDCPLVKGDPTDKITCQILTSAKGRTIPGVDPDGTQHSIFASVDFATGPLDSGPIKDGKNIVHYMVTGQTPDGTEVKGDGKAIVWVSDIPEPGYAGVLLALASLFTGWRLRGNIAH
jgi:hypothetical protein